MTADGVRVSGAALEAFAHDIESTAAQAVPTLEGILRQAGDLGSRAFVHDTPGGDFPAGRLLSSAVGENVAALDRFVRDVEEGMRAIAAAGRTAARLYEETDGDTAAVIQALGAAATGGLGGPRWRAV